MAQMVNFDVLLGIAMKAARMELALRTDATPETPWTVGCSGAQLEMDYGEPTVWLNAMRNLRPADPAHDLFDPQMVMRVQVLLNAQGWRVIFFEPEVRG